MTSVEKSSSTTTSIGTKKCTELLNKEEIVRNGGRKGSKRMVNPSIFLSSVNKVKTVEGEITSLTKGTFVGGKTNMPHADEV